MLSVLSEEIEDRITNKDGEGVGEQCGKSGEHQTTAKEVAGSEGRNKPDDRWPSQGAEQVCKKDPTYPA